MSNSFSTCPPSPPSPLSPPTPPAQPSFQLTFTHGFLVGQLSFLLVIVLFVRYVVFEDPKAPKPSVPRRKTTGNAGRTKPGSRRLSYHDKAHVPVVPELLAKLSYDLSSHPPETADWLNVLVAQAIVAYRSLVHGLDEDPEKPKGNKAKEMVEEAVNFARGEVPGIVSVDYITVTEVDFGQEYPVCTNARVRPADETGRMRVEVDVDYSDHVTLAIETNVVVNFPTARFAVLPISLGLTLNQLSATIMAEIPPVAIPLPMNHDPLAPSPAILVSLDPDFTLSMETTSLLGSRAKLQDLPKIEQLILSRIRGWMVDNLVWPKVRVLKLPGIGNRGSIEDAADGEGEFVWVEGAEEKATGKAEPTEADDDEGPISTLSPSPGSTPGHPLLPHRQRTLTPPPGPRPLGHRRSHSGSSPPTRLSHRTSHDMFVTPPRPRVLRPDHAPLLEMDEPHFSYAPPGALPPSDRSTGTYRQLGNPFGTRPAQWHQHPLGRPSGSIASEDRARWARAGGMSGVSMGLGTQVPGRGYGIRERFKEAERLKGRGSSAGSGRE